MSSSFVILKAILSPSQLRDWQPPGSALLTLGTLEEDRDSGCVDTWREQDLRECLAPSDPRQAQRLQYWLMVGPPAVLVLGVWVKGKKTFFSGVWF